MKSTLIIIPTYNEAQNIGDLLEKIEETLKGENFSILIVDDNSIDNTQEIVESKKKIYKNVFMLKRNKKLGLASAYIDGFNFGLARNFDNFIQMDADFSHNPVYLPEFIIKLKNNDVVIGSRNIKHGNVIGWSFIRNLISKGGSLYSKIVLNCPICDFTGGYNGWTKNTLLKIEFDKIVSKGYCFQIEMKYRAYKNNAKIAEFPIIFENRKFGESKMNKKIFIEALFNILKLKFILK